MSNLHKELLNLAELYFRQKNYGLAKVALEKALKINPSDPRVNELYAYVLGNRGDLNGAISYLEKSTNAKDCSASAFYELGNLYLCREDDKAVSLFKKAFALGLRTFEIYFKHGQALANLGCWQQAVDQFTLAKTENRYSPEASFNLAKLYELLGDSERALKEYENVIHLDPNFVPAWIAGGQILRGKGDLPAALNAFDKALIVSLNNPEILYLKGNLLRTMRRYEEAIEVYSCCLEHAPEMPFVFGNLVYTKLLICDWSHYQKELEKIQEQLALSKKVIPPFPFLALSDNPELQLQAAQIWVKNENQFTEISRVAPILKNKSKIRIGYFSADFGYHPVAFLIAEVFELHDREHFEIYGFSIGPNTGDQMRRRLERAFDRFIDCEQLSDEKIAQHARDLEIDIAIDLTGFTQDGRINIFALGVAPIQVNFLGYPGTLGASYIDYIIADPVLIPSDNMCLYSEKIAYLPDTYQPNDRKRSRLKVSNSRLESRLPEDAFIFSCFNNNFKITPKQLDLWAKILGQVTDSYLWLLEDNKLASKNLQNEIQKRGINPNRLIFAPRTSPEKHLARIACADLFLDTFPYNAHTTASDALWMGLPVLTRRGKSFASRVASSLLGAVGLTDLIVDSEDDYVQMAIYLARHPQKLNFFRSRLQEGCEKTPLFDSIKYTKNLENLYTQMQKNYKTGVNSKKITVD